MYLSFVIKTSHLVIKNIWLCFIFFRFEVSYDLPYNNLFPNSNKNISYYNTQGVECIKLNNVTLDGKQTKHIVRFVR